MSEIDVSKCRFRHISNMNNWLCTSNEFDISREPYCNNNKNCMYKQLQRYKQYIDEIEKICEEQNLKYDTTACDILQKIEEVKGE